MSRPSSPLGLVVLTYLSERPMHAYELFKVLELRDAGTVVPFSHGAVYSAVRQLERRGLIRATGVGRKGNLPRHTVYGLTDEGMAEMRTWLADLIRHPLREHQSFLAALSLMGALPPAHVVGHLEERLASLDDEIRTGQHAHQNALATGVHPMFLVEEELRLAQLTAERDFVHHLIARIQDSDGWAGMWQDALDKSARSPAVE